jgi:hypothetical protein
MIGNKNSHERFDTDNKNRHDHNGNAPLEAAERKFNASATRESPRKM